DVFMITISASTPVACRICLRTKSACQRARMLPRVPILGAFTFSPDHPEIGRAGRRHFESFSEAFSRCAIFLQAASAFFRAVHPSAIPSFRALLAENA